MIDNKLIFQSSRLGFRTWDSSDLDELARMNADTEVMRYFPATQSREQSREFIHKMQQHQAVHGFCYFAVVELESDDFVGFIGACHQVYDAPFTPCVDIGWRLLTPYWGKGYAQEGAKAILDFLSKFHLDSIYAVAPELNLPSIKVMERIGMTRIGTFHHPALINTQLSSCVYFFKSMK